MNYNASSSVLSFACKFSKYSFNQLIDKEKSSENIQKVLSDFCDKWRKQRTKETGKTVNHGGITANHYQLVWALLKVLPASMEFMRENQKRRFNYALQNGKFILLTTRPTLAKKMVEHRAFYNDSILPSVRTISYLLQRLEEAGVIISRRTIIENDKNKPLAEKKKSILIELNPALIALYLTEEELKEKEEPQSQESKEEPLGDILEAPAGEAAGEPATDKNINLQHYTNLSKGLKDNKDNINVVLATANSSKLVNKKVRSEGDIKPETEEEMLLIQLLTTVYKKDFVPDETKKAALSIFAEHLEASREVVRSWRKLLIKKVKANPKYQQAKDKNRFLLNFQKKLPDVNKRAFELVSEAIRIQAQYLDKKDYTLYKNICAYLTQNFYKPLEYAKKTLQSIIEHPINNTIYHLRSIIISKIWSAVSNVSLMFRKYSKNYALEVYGEEVAKLTKLLNSEQYQILTYQQRETYLFRLKNSIYHLFQK